MLRLSTCSQREKIRRSEERTARKVSLFISVYCNCAPAISARPRKRSTLAKDGLRTNELVEAIGQAALMIRHSKLRRKVRWRIHY